MLYIKHKNRSANIFLKKVYLSNFKEIQTDMLFINFCPLAIWQQTIAAAAAWDIYSPKYNK